MPNCVQCGEPLKCIEHGPTRKVGEVSAPCALKKGAVWVHVIDDEGTGVEKVEVTVDGAAMGSDKSGFSNFDNKTAANYTAKLSELTGTLKDLYDPPTEMETGAPVSDGEITYVPFELKRRALLNVKVVHKPKNSDPVKVFKDATVTVTGKKDLGNKDTLDTGLANFGWTSAGDYSLLAVLEDKYAKDFFAPDKAKAVTLAYGEDQTNKPTEIEVEPVNVVTPKIEVEYKLILLDRGLTKHQDKNKETLVLTDPTRIEVSFTQTNDSVPYEMGGKIKVDPADATVYLDEKCEDKDKLTADLTKDQLKAGEKLELYLKGTKAGKVKVSLELIDPNDKRIRLAEKPAEVDMGVVELKLEAHVQDATELALIRVNPDTELVATYHQKLRDQALPPQKKLTDEEKVKTGSLLHAQNSGNHGRAKLILAKLEGDQWLSDADGYDVVLNMKADQGAVEIHKKQDPADDKADDPFKIKVSELKKKDVELWVQGTTETKDFRQIRLDLGLDRDEGGLEKKAKRNGDWARFTVVKIKEVKLDYTPPLNKPNAWNEGDEKFYINFAANPHGRKVTIGATLSEKLKDIEIHFMLAPDKDNGKAANWGENLPIRWKWHLLSADLKHKDKTDRQNLLHLSAKTNDQGYAKVELQLSRFGGDIFTPAAYIDQDPHLAKYIDGHTDLEKRTPVFAARKLKVWRKFWYEPVAVEGIVAPGLETVSGVYAEVKVDMVATAAVQITRATVDGFNPTAIYPRYMIEVNGGNADALVVSDTNSAQFFAACVAEADKPIKVPVLLCDAQWDADGDTVAWDSGGWVDSTTFPLPATGLGKKILSPPLQGGDLLVSGEYIVTVWDSVSGVWNTGAWTPLANGDLTIDSARGDLEDLTINLPAGAGPADPDKQIQIRDLVVQAANDSLGEYDPATKRILSVWDPTDVTDSTNTIIHECGHAFFQSTGGTQLAPPTIPAHPHYYYMNGEHCRYSTDKCVMFESGPVVGGLNKYCPVCHLYVLVRDWTALR